MRRVIRIMIGLSVVVALTAPALGTSASAKSDAPDARPNWGAGAYIVRLKDGVSSGDVEQQRVTSRGGRVKQRYRAALNGFAADLSADEANALANDDRVASIMPDFEVQASAQTIPTGIRRVNATSSSLAQIDGVDQRVNVDVAVLDTGSGPHPDLNIVGGYDCTGSGSYNDNNGHGTHVAGTIGAIDNGSGVVGVAPGARIWSIKVLNAQGSGTGSQILCGIDWVKQNASTIEVVNMSLGGATTYTDDNNCGNTNRDVIHQAICGAVNAGVTFVVAAGNDGKNAANYFPAQYNEVITVSALDDTDGKPGGLGPSNSYGADDTLASFSNYGADVDVIAPGVGIYSTYLNNGYGSMSGTSMASPHVAGAAALYLAGHASASPAQVRAALISTGSTSAWSGDKDTSKESLIDVSTFAGPDAGGGGGGGVTYDASVNAVSAPASVTQGSSATISATIGNNGSASASVSVSFSEMPGGASQTKSVTVAAGATSSVSFAWTTSSSTAIGTHTFTVSAAVPGDSNAANNSGTAATTVQAQAAGATTMSVSTMTLTQVKLSRGYRLAAKVYIKSNATLVPGARVTVKLIYPNGSTVSLSATTNSSGYAAFTRSVISKGTYTLQVTNVSKSGLTYNAGGNVVSSKSVTIS